MKHTKKMIMVPEVEYQTLMNMIKGENPLTTEKAVTETEIKKVLHDPKLSELVKGKKYDLLVKKRQKLKAEQKREAEKPNKVLLDDAQLKELGKATTPRYMGVALTDPEKPGPSKVKRKTKVRKKRIVLSSNESDGEEDFQETAPYIIHPNYYKDVLKILKNKKQQYGINDKLELVGIPDSSITDILDYLTGQKKDRPGGTDALLERIKDEQWWKTGKNWANIHKQRGEGKKKRRVKKEFKPLIWARL